MSPIWKERLIAFVLGLVTGIILMAMFNPQPANAGESDRGRGGGTNIAAAGAVAGAAAISGSNLNYDGGNSVALAPPAGANPCGLGGIVFTYAGRLCVIRQEANAIGNLGGAQMGLHHLAKHTPRVRATLKELGVIE